MSGSERIFASPLLVKSTTDFESCRRPKVLNKWHIDGSLPATAKYCGRPSPLGNPFVIGRDGTREAVIAKHKAWLPTQPHIMAMIPDLKGFDLVCHCAPEPCHCDILLVLANPEIRNPPGIRLLVCGGRDYDDRDFAFACLDRVNIKSGIALIIEGGAKGADRLAREWAECRARPFETYPAQWKTDGKSAGFTRNQRMLDEGKPDGVVAFPGGRGTADMIRRAKSAAITVWSPRT